MIAVGSLAVDFLLQPTFCFLSQITLRKCIQRGAWASVQLHVIKLTTVISPCNSLEISLDSFAIRTQFLSAQSQILPALEAGTSSETTPHGSIFHLQTVAQAQVLGT